MKKLSNLKYLLPSYYLRRISPVKKRYFDLILGAFLVIAVPLVIATLVNPGGKASAAWFNDDWGYRKAITVTVTSNSSDITNLQTLLTVDTTGITAKLQSSCQDLRFTNTSGKLLPYYIDSCNNNSATNKIWVLADLVPKNTTTYTLYMYYGNPSAAAGSSSQPYFDNVVGLVGYWTLNESSWTGDCSTSVVNDSSVKGNLGKACPNGSAPSPTSGKYGNAGSFDGSNDYIELNNPSVLQITGNLTIEAWVKLTDNTSAHTISSKMSSGVGQYSYRLYAGGDAKLRMEVSSDGTSVTTVVGNTTLSTGTWYHVAGVYNPSNSLTVYVNGTQDNTNTSSIPASIFNGNATVEIGAQSAVNVFYGLIDDVLVYNTNRTAGQIAVDYSTTYSIQTTNPSTITPSTSFATEEKAPQPISWWKFDDGQGTNAQDSTTNNKDGTLSGTTKPTWQTEDLCVSGKCLYFDGSTSYVSLGNNALGSMSGAFSLETWIKTTSSAAGQAILSEYSSGVCGDGLFYIDVTTGYPRFHDGNNSYNTFSKAVNDGIWHHITYVYNGTNGTMYIDGVAGTDTTGTSWVNNCSSVDVRIGSAVGNLFFKGFIDDLKVYNYARSAVQVKADFNARQNPHGAAGVVSQGPNNQPGALSNGLVGYWKMDEASGTTATSDSSGNSNTGTSTSTTNVGAGKFGNARTFNGTNQRITTASSTSLSPTTSITISAWINAANGTDRYIVTKGEDSFYFALGPTGTTANKISMYLNGVSSSWLQGTTSLNDSAWHHVVGTWNGATMKLFVDGHEENSTAVTGTISTGSSSLEIGSRGNVSFFSGSIDETRVYNRALSPAEVTQLYNFAPGPVGYWKFDENSGSTASDASGNANSGTATGSPSWVAGKYGSALKYNGSSQYTSITAGSALQITNGLTAEAWINPAAASNFVLFKETAGGNGDWWINFGSGNWQCATAGGTGTVATGVAATLNQWTHITLAYSASSLKCYVNGVPSGTTDTTPGTLTGNTNAVMVAGYPTTPTTYFNGSVDDVRIYNYERTQDQIISDMNAGHPVVGSPVGSPLGYWKFDEGYGTTANNSGNAGSSINGTLNGSTLPSWSNSGKFGKALSFNGSTGYISQALVTATKPANLTFSAWVNPTVNNVNMMIAELEPAGATGDGRGAYIALDSNGKLNFCKGSATGSYSCATSATTVSAGSWQHVEGSFDGSTVKVFLNGVQEASTSNSSAISYADLAGGYPTPGQLYIGAHKTNAVGGGNTVPDTWFFNGLIDEVKLYNYALTADQVKLDMNRQSAQVLGALSDNSSYQTQAANQEYCVPGDSTSCAAPVGEWKFDENSGSTVNDTSGNGNTGTWSGTLGSQWKPGKVGPGGNFNGSDNKITVNDSSSIKFGTGNFTISFWVKTGQTSNIAFVTKRDAAGGQDWYFGSQGTNALLFYCAGCTTQGNVSTSITFRDNNWHNIVATRTTATINFYLDGVFVNSTGNVNANFNNTNNLLIGQDASVADKLQGQMDNLRLYSYARSQAQISWDYNHGGPVGHWRLDECQGNKLNDSSGNGNSQTITVGGLGTYTSLGTCASSSASTMWYNGATGKRNYSLAFDGTDDYAQTGSLSYNIGGTQPFTQSAWVKTSSKPTGSNYNDITMTTETGQGDTTFDKGLLIDSSGHADFYVFTGVTNHTNGTTDITDNNWHLITATYDGTNTKLYVDGVLQTTGSASSTFSFTTPQLVVSFSNGTLKYFPGQIDDIRIYNYALTATQVKQLYNENFSTRYGPVSGAP